jgi:hypothetical protein
MGPILLRMWFVLGCPFWSYLTSSQDTLKSPEELENEDREAQSAVGRLVPNLV